MAHHESNPDTFHSPRQPSFSQVSTVPAFVTVQAKIIGSTSKRNMPFQCERRLGHRAGLVATRSFDQALEERILICPSLQALGRLGRIVCLHIVRAESSRSQPSSKPPQIVQWVSEIPGFGPGPGKEWRVMACGIGRTWRPKQSVPYRLNPVEWQRIGLRDMSYGKEIPTEPSSWGPVAGGRGFKTDGEHFTLSFHSWGASAIDLARVSDLRNVTATELNEKDENRPCSKPSTQCGLCRKLIRSATDMNQPCIFHPGTAQPRPNTT